MDPTARWLLSSGDLAVRAQALVHLAGRSVDDPDVREARASSVTKGSVARLLDGLVPAATADALYLPKYGTPWHRVIALAEMGAPPDEPRLAAALDACLQLFEREGGGFGRREGHLCTTGNLVRASILLGRGDDPRVERAVEWLVAAQKTDGGWHCFGSDVGSLDGWEALAAFAAMPATDRPREVVARGVEFFLSEGLGVTSTYAPYARIHWPRHYYYDILVGLDVVTSLGAGADPRLAPALAWLEAKRGADGRWRLDVQHPDLTLEAGYTLSPTATPLLIEPTGVPSEWATLVALRVLGRAQRPDASP